MALKVDKVQLEIILKADSARAEMIKLEDEAKLIQNSMKGLKKDTEQWIAANDKLKDVLQKQDDLRKSIGLTENTMRELKQMANTLRIQLNNMTPGSEQFVRTQSDLNAVNERMRELRTSSNNTKQGIGALTDQLTEIPGPIGSVIQGIKGFGTALKTLLLNPVGLLIAAIVGGLMLMYKAFMSTDEGVNMFNGVLKAMSNIMDVVLDRVMSYIKLIGSILTLDMEGIKKNGSEAFSGIASSIRDAAKAGYEYEQIMDSIADRESASLIRSSKLRAEIEKLKNAAKDSTKPIAERIKLNDLAMQKEKELLGIEKGFMKEKLDAEISNLASKLQVQGLSVKQKEQQIREWLKLDDRQIEQYAKNNSRFANFVNKNEAEFQKLQKQKSEDFDKDAEFEQGTRRLQKESSTFKAEILKQQNDNAKASIEERIKTDIKLHDKWYSDSLNALRKQQIDEGKSTEWFEAEKRKVEEQSLEKKKVIYKNNASEIRSITEKQLGMQLEDLQKSNTASLAAINMGNEARIKSTESYEQTKKQKLQDDLEAELITQEQYNASIAALDVQLADRRLQDAIAYRDLILAAKYNTDAEREAATKAAEAGVDAANKSTLTAQKAANKQKQTAEKEHQNEVDRIRKELGLDKEKLNYKQGIDALKEKLNKAEATEKEKDTALNEYRLGKTQEYLQTTQQIVDGVSQAVSAYHQMEFDSLNAMKQKELAAAGDNATAREEIEKKYAQKELDLKKKQATANMAIQIAQAVAAGALAIANIWAVHAANPILAGILTALSVGTSLLQIASLVKQNAAIQATTLDTTAGGDTSTPAVPKTGARVATPQAADGRWDVMGEQDRKTYRNVRYMGRSRTGLVTTPTLYGEAGTELVIDAPTLRRLNTRAPGFNRFVMQNRVVPQRADGNFAPAGGAAPVVDNTPLLAANLEATNQLIGLVQDLQQNGIEAWMLYDKYQKQQLIYEKSISKGSLT